MITKLHLVNWKSFEDSTIYIDPLTFLIGTNASGKSNVLDAFLFLHLLMKGQTLEDAAAAIRGGEDWIIRKGQTDVLNMPVALLYRLQIKVLRQSVTKVEHQPQSYYRFRLRTKVGDAGYDRWLKDTFGEK